MQGTRTASFKQLLDLLPEIDALEVLRIALARHAVTRPDHVWSDGSRAATVDVRVLDSDAIRAAVAEAAEEQHRDTDEIFRSVGEVLVAELDGDREAAALRLVRAGEGREARGRYASALRFYRAALQAAGPLPQRAVQILALRRLGRVQIVRGELAEAERCYRQSLDLAIAVGGLQDEVIARTGLGNLCVRAGHWADAEATYTEALSRTEGPRVGELSLERAQLMNNLARVAAHQERLDEARGWLAEAGKFWRESGSPVDRAVWTSIRALVLWKEGNLEAACEVYEEAIRANPPRVHRASYEIDIANLMAQAGRLDDAWEWGRAAEASALAAAAVGYIAHVYHGLGNVAQQSGTEAVAFYEKAIEVARHYGLRLEEAVTLIDYARLRAVEGNRDEAEAFLVSARDICLALGAGHQAKTAESVLRQIQNETGAEAEVPA